MSTIWLDYNSQVISIRCNLDRPINYLYVFIKEMGEFIMNFNKLSNVIVE